MRHGKTDWNEKRKLQGRTDVPLNESGRAMAENAAKECEGVHFDVCFSSPLNRALETAQIVLANRGVPIITDDRLMEMSFGVLEGAEDSSKIPNSPIYYFFNSPEKYVIPAENGESFKELFNRTGEFLKDKVYPLLEQEKDVLIVGHGAMNSSIICQIRNLPIEEFWSAGLENCKLIRLL